MEVSFKLCLPRDEASVPLVRHMCRTSLQELGVAADSIGDIEVAVSEACTNVLRHVLASENEYEVEVRINETECVISVVDTGGKLDVSALPPPQAAPTAESGRGVHLMKALVDELDFVSDPGSGTVVRLRKGLSLLPGSILARLGDDGDEAPTSGTAVAPSQVPPA